MGTDNSLWTDDELRDAVFAYKRMQRDLDEGKPVVKKAIYRALSEKWGRTEKSYERRMGNISAVLEIHGRSWIKGLKPLFNVGTNVMAVIEKCLIEAEGIVDFSDVKFELDVARKYKSGQVVAPIGIEKPASKMVSIAIIDRNSDVKAWLLVNSKGLCESCNTKAPFVSITGVPYLEIHHVKRLADSGSDTIDNAVAICPNCHRALHYSNTKEKLIESLYERIPRLKKY